MGLKFWCIELGCLGLVLAMCGLSLLALERGWRYSASYGWPALLLYVSIAGLGLFAAALFFFYGVLYGRPR